MNTFEQNIEQILRLDYAKTPKEATLGELYNAVSRAAVAECTDAWTQKNGKRACYFSAEFLMGRLFHSNLLNLRLLERAQKYLEQYGVSIADFEEIEDAALGNGGLGRLAACFLDSAASHNIPLDGYGIRYRYGLFKQSIENGFQCEQPDVWQSVGDPWSIRRDSDTVLVQFGDYAVKAVPYDMPVIGWNGKTVNTLRLWQSEPTEEFNFTLFNEQKYDEAVRQKNRAEDISAVLYPNDDTNEGKRLRLRQQYFFSSASLQSMLREHQKAGRDIRDFAKYYAVQLNDTHPVVAIPELMRILMEKYLMTFDEAFFITREVFAYTNHTVLPEALEKWDVSLFASLLPQVYPYVVMLQNCLSRTLRDKSIPDEFVGKFDIISDGRIAMANMAVYATHCVNGVAAIHTQILKDTTLAQWHWLYPDRIINKTNGITQRRWLALCNPELSKFLTDRVGDGWITDLNVLKKLEDQIDDKAIEEFISIKETKKSQLANYIKEKEGKAIPFNFIYDIQIKRLHEYKRQLLNALAILDTYYGLKDGRITDFEPTAWIFGAKAAPGYRRAKGIIKLIGEIAKLVNNDPEVCNKMLILFVQNYNVSYAEKLIPAADVSQQISTAGTEASGTGNMKLMLNGAVTLGTLDGANVEIVEQAGRENNYIFGKTVEEIEQAKVSGYSPMELYQTNSRIKAVMDALVDGTLDDGNTGMFRELYDAILHGASWHQPDHYFLLLDLMDYCDTRLRLNRDYKNRKDFAKKQLVNIANAGKFSSDRTIKEYAKEIWGV